MPEPKPPAQHPHFPGGAAQTHPAHPVGAVKARPVLEVHEEG
jgi:hypothetical protein